MLSFIVNHFSHAFPTLLCGGFAILICIERGQALFHNYPLPQPEKFFEHIRTLIMKDKITEAVALCEKFRASPTARVVREGLVRAHQPETLIEHGLQLAVADATGKVQSKTPFLATIANVATLTGLFGTIVGLVQSFEAVGGASAQERSALLANGISVAMNATMMGLGVAIPCMIAFSIFMSRTNTLIAEIDQSAVRIMDLIQQRYFTTKSHRAASGDDTFSGHVGSKRHGG